MDLTEHYDYYPANWQSSRGGYGILVIVVHGTVGTDSRRYLQRGGELRDGSDRKVSIHVLLDKAGRRWRMVDDARVANHAGYATLTIGGRTYSPQGRSVNVVSLGVELENLQNGRDPYPDEQLLGLGHLINDWRGHYGPLPVVRHADIDPTRRSDPLNLSVSDIEGWCHAAADQRADGPAGRMLRVVAPAGARVRSAPTTAASTLDILSQATLVETFGEVDGPPPLGQRDRRWTSVRLADGRRGYIWTPLLGGVS